MFLARFPAEILIQLTGKLIAVDLVLLHACGDSLLNQKMRTAPISFRVITDRCRKYCKGEILSRFGNIENLVHFSDTYDNLKVIPSTVKNFVTNFYVMFKIPASVEEVTAGYISKFASFERKPGELSVSAKSASGDFNEYITHLLDHANYDRTMVNLRMIDVPIGIEYGAPAGVEIRRVPPICKHSAVCGTEPAGNIWTTTECQSCKKVLNVTTNVGKTCLPIPPCDSVRVSIYQFSHIEQILRSITGKVGQLWVHGSSDDMNNFIISGGLDRIPSGVERLKITIVRELMIERFVGVKKRYPFEITIYESSLDDQFGIDIVDFDGIDGCHWNVLRDDAGRKKILAQYPRLSIVF